MKRIYSRISEDLDRKLGIACVERGLNRPKALIAAIQQWVMSDPEEIKDRLVQGRIRVAAARSETPVIGSGLSEAILKLDDARNILDGIRNDIYKGDTVSRATGAKGDITRAIEGLSGTQGEHPRAVGDLGQGTDEPGAWRKRPKPKGPTRTGPT